MITITFANGKYFEAHSFDGCYYISDTDPSALFTNDALKSVKITGNPEGLDDEVIDLELKHVQIASFKKINDKLFATAFYELPEEYYKNIRRDANIDYIAMMADVELPQED